MLVEQKKRKRVFFIILVSLVALLIIGYISLYLFINEKGKDLLEGKLRANGIDARIYEVNFTFPFRVSIVDLETPKFSFLKANGKISGFSPFEGLIFSELYIKGLRLNIDRQENNISNTSTIAANKNQEQSSSRFGSPFVFGLKAEKIILDYANVLIVDKSIDPPLTLEVSDIYAIIRNFRYPLEGKVIISKFESDIVFNGNKMNDVLEVSGWVDWPGKNMNVLAKFKELNYAAFSDYYPTNWKPKNMDLEHAYLSLNALLDAQKDRLTVNTYVILNDIKFKDNPQNQSRVKTLKTIIALLERNGVVYLDFDYVTKMSAPRFGRQQFKQIIQGELKRIGGVWAVNILNQLIGRADETIRDETIRDSVDNIKGLTLEPVIKGIEGFGNQLLDGIRKAVGAGNRESGDK
jgi:hypothetical protein